ncbi:MAG: transcription antitermination factor NusB [Chitinophagaceae bacterium]|nr:transcription antitermination factor NusB [Chitinophagaceae bacterium]
MITRRNIRVKVMQLLYSIDSINDTNAIKNPTAALEKKFTQTSELLTFLFHHIVLVAKYAEVSAKSRASKYIPTEEDLNVNTKVSGNQILWEIVENSSYQNAIESFKTDSICDSSIVRKLFTQLIETKEYQHYIHQESRDRKEELEMLSFIFNNIMLQSDLFISTAEDYFDNWDDDAEMLQTVINSYFNKIQSLKFHQLIDADKLNYAKTLLNTCIEKKEFLLECITPKFKNWDADRIASIDLIILQMGLAELLYFETIPTKVTINEYIDIAKEYSTVQSGQFVNGILDNLHKEMLTQGKIHKVDFKKVKK